MTPEGRVVALRRWLDDLGDDPAVLADLAVADESQLLVGRQGAVEEEAGRNRTRVLGIALYVAAAETCDQLESPGERRRGDALAPVPLADEVAGDPPVRQGREALLVGGAVLDLRHLVRRAELAPTHTVVAIEHKGRVRPACPHPCELAFPVQRRLAAVIRMKAHLCRLLAAAQPAAEPLEPDAAVERPQAAPPGSDRARAGASAGAVGSGAARRPGRRGDRAAASA